MEDATITMRKHLDGVYGKEKAAEMIDSIRQREAEKGSAKQYADFVQQWGKAREDRDVTIEKERQRFSKAGLNPDLAELSAQYFNVKDFHSRHNLDPDTVKTGNRFAIPIYSDKNLDKPVSIVATDSKEMFYPQYNFTAAADATPRGETEPNNLSGHYGINPVINVNKDEEDWTLKDLIKDPLYYSKKLAGGWKDYSMEIEQGPPHPITGLPITVRSRHIPNNDILGHELTHTVQPNFTWQPATPEKTEYMTGKQSGAEDTKRKEYTQNAFEPAARFSELKHMYFKETGNLLKADMAPEQSDSFKNWYQDPKSGVRSPYFDDTMQLLDTPEGEELFRRTAKVNKPSTTSTQSTGLA